MTAGMSRPARIAFIVSLALNVFAIGAVASALILGGPVRLGFGDPPARFIGVPMPRHLHAALPERDRPVLRETMEAHRPGIRARAREIFATRREVADAIRAEPFDRARLEASLAQLRDKEGATAAETHRMIVDLAGRLDAEGRARVAELMQVRPRRSR